MNPLRLCSLPAGSSLLPCSSRSTPRGISTSARRTISVSAVQHIGRGNRVRERRDRDENENDESRDGDGNRPRRWWSADRPPELDTFLRTEGKQFMNPTKPKNWLGGEVPFPMNPSFKPPTPLSNELRNSIFTMHMANPTMNSSRVIAKEYGLSIKRVEAVLKLKFVEHQWRKEGKVIQSGFVDGMETLLGVEEDARTLKAKRAVKALSQAPLGPPDGFDEFDSPQTAPRWGASSALSHSSGLIQPLTSAEVYPEVHSRGRANTQAADEQVEEEGEQGLRDRERYRRMYWESVDHNQAPIVPQEVEKARVEGKERRENLRTAKSHPTLLTGVSPPKFRATGRPKTVVVERPNRPTIKFVDVGGKFLDVDQATKRVRTVEEKRHH